MEEYFVKSLLQISLQLFLWFKWMFIYFFLLFINYCLSLSCMKVITSKRKWNETNESAFLLQALISFPFIICFPFSMFTSSFLFWLKVHFLSCTANLTGKELYWFRTEWTKIVRKVMILSASFYCFLLNSYFNLNLFSSSALSSINSIITFIRWLLLLSF